MTDCNVDTTVDRLPMTGTVVGYDPGGNGNQRRIGALLIAQSGGVGREIR